MNIMNVEKSSGRIGIQATNSTDCLKYSFSLQEENSEERDFSTGNSRIPPIFSCLPIYIFAHFSATTVQKGASEKTQYLCYTIKCSWTLLIENRRETKLNVTEISLLSDFDFRKTKSVFLHAVSNTQLVNITDIVSPKNCIV